MNENVTNKEVINYLRAMRVVMFHGGKSKWTESIDVAISALEKSIPKKPEMRYTQLTSRWCYCGTYLGFKFDGFKYCPTCGQAIDWSDENNGGKLE